MLGRWLKFWKFAEYNSRDNCWVMTNRVQWVLKIFGRVFSREKHD